MVPRPEIRAFLDDLAADGVLPLAEMGVPAARRQMLESSLQLWGTVEHVEHVGEFTLPTHAGVVLRSYRPNGESVLPAVVYFHGGGWVVGSIETHDGFCRRLANLAGCAVFSVGYRLAPENPFPAAANDAADAALWVCTHSSELGIDPLRVSVAGDSAGGNLAAVAARRLSRQGMSLASQVLIYPVTDGSTDTPSYEANADGVYLTRADMGWYLSHYAANDSDLRDPDFAPLRAEDLRGLPPAHIAVCELDPLHDDGTRYAERLYAAGVPVTLDEWSGMIHGFALMRTVTGAADELLARVVRFLLDGWKR